MEISAQQSKAAATGTLGFRNVGIDAGVQTERLSRMPLAKALCITHKFWNDERVSAQWLGLEDGENLAKAL
ncbi:Hypothetical protein DEACI_1178 [Acididesulfobacillus acetoxydans]|uniref:Uncharacterized protein n=1 Tax=Acididesulfobacillus acetoxydans TaxID=1561005 RepID=A0A8S0Y2A0_9FIRM|nr:hypothetical protein [Acididesulfobacillus acetoxydans]CAA7600525.1 Hypothetical protein DEACI_1178 [Acididesulfobacillus acetoxydans]CEJ06659.1 Hypothetical protein DEACI_1108 [Acididesulfobacillus acetoxydans]